jgi:hypothetical protein
MSIRVHELAKKLGMENKDLISLLKARNYDVKTSSSTVDNISAAALELEFPNAAAAAPAPNAAPAPAVAVPTVDWAKPHSKGPVGPMVKSADDVVRERSETAARLAADAGAAVEELGLSRGETVLTALFNTQDVHNLVVCTLCSCYPRSVLGRPPAWYKSRAYRARAVRDPRGVLAEFGTQLPEGTSIRVHDSNAELRYLVVPRQPAGTEGWDAAALEKLVTRDAMIGVTEARQPL